MSDNEIAKSYLPLLSEYINKVGFPAKEYEIVPTETYKILRKCPGCGSKTVYHNTNKVRVNANGKQLDVWLIYQCSKCKHTYNLPIQSRINRRDLNKTEYQAILKNDRETVYQYGLNRNLFQLNNAQIYKEPSYEVRYLRESIEQNTMRFFNPHHLRIRYDKLISECLQISRTKAKQILETGLLSVNHPSENEIVLEMCSFSSS